MFVILKKLGTFTNRFFIDTYTKVGFAKLYDRKNALVVADLLNDKVIPFFEEHNLRLLRMLTDRGTEYCGSQDHDYELFLTIEEEIDHTKIKAKSPQTNGICERFNKTMIDSVNLAKEHYIEKLNEKSFLKYNKNHIKSDNSDR